MKKRVGIFTGFFLPHLGGVERYVDKLSAALQNLGYEVFIITSNHGRLKSYEKIDNRVVYRLPIYNLMKNRYPIPRRDTEYRNLIDRVEDEKLDYFIVNTRFYLLSFIGAKMGKRLGRPVMLIEHGTDHFSVNNKFLDRFGLIYEHALTKRIKKYVDKFYGVSKSCNEWLKHFSVQASGVIYNAVDISDRRIAQDNYYNKYSNNEVIVSYAGRLIREKGILNLLEAFKIVRQKNPELRIKLAVAGDGELLNIIKRDYNDQSIDILGKLDFKQVMSLYKRTDIFVNPSQYPEGLPTSILEAGLMGCAVIATPRGGTEEVIIDKRHGIIVDGTKESLSRAIEQLSMDDRKRKEMADRLRQRIESVFNWETVAKEADRYINSFKAD
jgi:glycosyltransferase involved in cell wall biosynthesis